MEKPTDRREVDAYYRLLAHGYIRECIQFEATESGLKVDFDVNDNLIK